MFSNTCHNPRDEHARQAIAARKRIVPDAGDGIGHDDARQAIAFPKGIISNARHRIGNTDATQFGATLKCVFSYTRYGIGLTIIFYLRWNNHIDQRTLTSKHTYSVVRSY